MEHCPNHGAQSLLATEPVRLVSLLALGARYSRNRDYERLASTPDRRPEGLGSVPAAVGAPVRGPTAGRSSMVLFFLASEHAVQAFVRITPAVPRGWLVSATTGSMG